MSAVGDGPFHKGQPVWVVQSDGSRRAGEFVGESELNAWLGGEPSVIIVYPDTRSGETVAVERVIPR